MMRVLQFAIGALVLVLIAALIGYWAALILVCIGLLTRLYLWSAGRRLRRGAP